MKRVLSLCMMLMLAAAVCFAQGPRRRGNAGPSRINPRYRTLISQFEADSVPGEDYTLRYRIRSYDAGEAAVNEKPALFLFLHGASGRGTDNAHHLAYSSLAQLDTFLVSKRINAYVLAPQCPPDRTWGEIPGRMRGEGTPVGERVLQLVDQIVRDKGIDPARIYLMGTSMGAAGAWRLITLRPDLFAAAQIASAAPKLGQYEMEKVVRTPIYFTLGEFDLDDASKYAGMIDYMKEHNKEFIFTLLPGLNHVQASNQAYTPASLEYLWRHTR